MQKKTKSRLVDVLVVIICLAGSALSVWQFWNELNRSLEKLNEEPIATITFKYNTAQRKFSDNLVWDRLRQNSPVYNGDTIRTADFSEATIYFNDGNIMDLSENTMARVSLSVEGGAAIDFSGGQIAVQSADSGIKITSGSSTVDVVKGASVTASSVPAASGVVDKGSDSKVGSGGQEVFRVQVQSGTAELSSGTNQKLSLEAGGAADMKDDGNVVRTYLSVISPDPETKHLIFDDEAVAIPFHWDSDGDDVTLEFSDTKNFTTIREAYEYSDIDTATLTLSAGTHYWRMWCGEENMTGKITVYNSKAPAAVAPVPDYTAYYRTVKPSIRFIWSESERSTTYAFEVADNPDMRNPVISQRIQQTSSIVTTLDEGKWYWRVTPYYTINNLGFAHPSDVYSFSIAKSGALEPPELLLPKSGSVVSTKVAGTDGKEPQNILFSWKDNPEASSYTITITPDSPAYGSSIVQTVNGNYFSLDTAVNQVGNGSWKWSVEMTDVEGNKVKSEKIPFMAMDSEITQKPVFPGEGYKLSVGRVRDTNFVWKSNLASDMEVQFAKDASFRNIATSIVTKNTSASGFDLEAGDYYWRIVTTTDAGVFTSDAVRFEVEPPLPAPACAAPVDATRVVVSENKTIALSWKPISTANYYQLRVYGANDMNEAIYENTYIEDDGRDEFTEYVSFAGLPEQVYYWTVQAFRDETTTMSRAVGLLGRYSFNLRVLKPITLSAPSEKTVFEGLDVVMNPPDMVWNSIDELNESELLIYKDSVDEENLVATVENPEPTATMPRLYEGSYFWTVRGLTFDDLDASSKQIRSFSVKKIPPMDAPVKVAPAPTDVFSTEHFENTLDITFSWKPVQYATKYMFTLIDEDGTVLKTAEIPSPNTSYSVNFGDIVHEGSYTWTVEARTVFDDGVVRYGNKEESSFAIYLPEMDAPVKNPVGDQNVLDENIYFRDKNIRFSWNEVRYADEYVFTLKNAHGATIAKEFMRSHNAVAAVRNTVPETFFVYKDVMDLKPGTYLWTIEARNYINGNMMQGGKIEDSSFEIKVNDMPAPEKIYPTGGTLIGNELFAADKGLKFTWRPVEFAGDYVFRLYDFDGNQMVEQVVTNTEYTYNNLDSLEKNKYSWTVEARSYLGDMLLQNGTVKQSQFEIYLPLMKAPEKVTPRENYNIDAEFFISDRDMEFKWNPVQYADEYILTIIAPDDEIVTQVSLTGAIALKYQIPSLKLVKRGQYKWTVEALSHYHGRLLQNGETEESIFYVQIPDLEEAVLNLPTSSTVLTTTFFRQDNPLDFSWNSVPLADEYVLTLYNPSGEAVSEQHVSETHTTVDVITLLEPGEYTWTVEALSHYKGEIFQHGKLASRNFTVSLPNLDAPQTVAPVNGTVLGLEFFRTDEPLTFSWNRVISADDYLFTLYSPDGDVLVSQDVTETSVTVDAYTVVNPGEYLWTVEARTLYKEFVLQHGVLANANLTTNVPRLDTPVLSVPSANTEYNSAYFKRQATQDFRWNNVPFADEYAFTLRNAEGNVIAEKAVPAGTLSVTLDNEIFSYEGEYTWDVEARTYFRDKLLQTSELAERQFDVVMPPLPVPVNRLPAEGARFGAELFKRDEAVNFSWSHVDEVDRYILRVMKADGTVITDTIVQADGATSGSTIRYRADAPDFIDEGIYTWTVEAQVIYKGRVMRTSGEVENTFAVALVAPSAPKIYTDSPLLIDASYINSNDVVTLSWAPVEFADEYNLVVYDTDGSVKKKMTVPSASNVIATMPISEFFEEGSYRWTVEACIRYLGKPLLYSKQAESQMNVEMPEMSAPTITTPENGEVLSTAYFRENREIEFRWVPVLYASGYNMCFYNPDGNVIMERQLGKLTTSVSWNDLTSLEAGTFRCTIQAFYSKDETLLVEGEIQESEFTIELPTLKAPTIGNTGNLYGY